MNGPRRLREEGGSELERALLEAGSSYRVSAETRAKTLAALGLAGAATLSATVAGAAAAGGAGTSSAGSVTAGSVSLLSKLGWAKVLGGVMAASVVAGVPGGYLVWREVRPPAALAQGGTSVVKQRSALLARAADAERAAVARAAAPTAPGSRATDSAQRRSSAEGRSDASRRGLAEVAPAPRSEPRAVSGSAALRGELTALDAVRGRLGRGQSAEALAALDAYDRAHPRGRLRLEAEVLRIEALARTGQAEAARQRAQAFLRRHPNSVLASRVQRYAGL